MRNKKRLWVGVTGGVGVAVIAVVVAAVLIVTGIAWPNRVFAAGYAVRGVDVSSYQGNIDWQVLARQNIDFAFIKATEGSGDQDPRFAANWAAARKTGLAIGAYHFLSFDSPGETQAVNILRTVPSAAGTLPVAVDVELYGSYFAHPTSKARVHRILDPLIATLQRYYGRAPILYSTGEAYDRYLKGAYPDDPLWYRSVALPPDIPDHRAWTFWQYSDREKLRGYTGDEQYVDMNAFSGSLSELKQLAQSADH